jgi:hypothetical protein
VDELVMSFHKQQLRNQDVLMVVWGLDKDTVHEALDACASTETEDGYLTEVDLQPYVDLCEEMGPISGNHTTHANEKLRFHFPKHPVWKYMIFNVMFLEGNHDDMEMALCYGQQSNYMAGKFLKPTFADSIRALHKSMENKIAFLGRKPATEDLLPVKQQWAQFNSIKTNSIGTYWNLAKRRGKLWSHIDAVLSGQVKRVQGNAPFKIPRSQYPFILMGKIPEDILEQFFRNVVAGLWSLKAFTDECKSATRRQWQLAS